MPEESDGSTDAPSGPENRSDGAYGDALPDGVADDAERLTRLARGAVDEAEKAAYRTRRDELLAEHGFRARIRGDDAGDDAVLVCYPAEWIEDGIVQIDRIEDVDRGVERLLEGPGEGDWDAVAARNDEFVEQIEQEYGSPHDATARALADFASNHYAKPIPALTPAEIAEFSEDYFRRNVWPSDEQAALIDESLDRIAEEIDAESGDPP